ncbi:MAG: hypothetical protein HKN45_02720 [Flavobacteriales bacterium]|nr:hypothetical protein [Flavobacteriales bacterium]NNK80027.1 hypothetical protein [Flavobacteriales bacterium]
MKISVELSMYPLNEDYKAPIIQFVESLRAREDLVIKTNGMSSQLFGQYDVIMSVLAEEIKVLFNQEDKVVIVMKLVNDDLDGPVKF